MSDLKGALTRYVEEQTPGTPPPFERVDVRARRRARPRTAALAAVPVVLAATFAGVQMARDPAPPKAVSQATQTTHATQTTQATQATTPGPSQGPISPGISSASCVEQYAPAAVRSRAFAFDGTVSRVAATQPPVDNSVALPGYSAVTFDVHEWFRGGDQATVTVDMMSPPSPGVVSSVEGLDYEVGTRLLVSGEPRFGGSPLDAPVAWACGFTRVYDPPTAAAWR